MRGFSLIEMVVAIAIMGSLVVAVSLVALGMPLLVGNVELEEEALERARALLGQTSAVASTTVGGFTYSLRIEEREDESFSALRALVSWDTLFGTPQTLSLESRVERGASTNSMCDSFISGDWTHPLLRASYLLPSSMISALAATPSLLVVATASSTVSTAPTLFFFTAHGTLPNLALVGQFDNASTSRSGFSSVAVAGEYVFAGNAFESKSRSTCGDGVSCAQVQVFRAAPESVPVRAGALTLATTSPPHAALGTGENAGVASLYYYKEYLYIGLQKTGAGDEFNIVDAHDPENLRWIASFRVGRTVTDIVVRGAYAYLSTDDPVRELLIINIEDSNHPVLAGIWDAPGAAGFGYGRASLVRGGMVRFGRSYSPNGAELSLIDARDSAHIQLVESYDSGPASSPESVRSFLSQDTLMFLLLTHRLEFWDTSDPMHLSPYAPTYPLPAGSTGAAMACRDNLLYVGRNISSGNSVIDVLQGI